MKILTRLTALIVLILVAGVGASVVLILSVSADMPIHSQDSNPPTFPANPLLTPANGATINTFAPAFDWEDAADPADGVVSYTLVITSPTNTMSVTTADSIYTPTTYLSNGVYTWTVQAHDAAGNVSELVTPPYTVTIEATWQVFLPIIMSPICPTASSAVYSLIPIDGPPPTTPTICMVT